MARAALESALQGALRTADTNRTEQKCTTVGVPNAEIVRWLLRTPPSATSAMTTNWSPVSAAADDPTMT